MRNMKKLGTCLGFILIVICIFLFSFSNTNQLHTLSTQQLNQMPEEKRMELLQNLSFEELVALLNGDHAMRINALDTVGASVYEIIAILSEQSAGKTNEELLTQITNRGNMESVKNLMVELYLLDDVQVRNTEPLKLLLDSDIPDSTKDKIIRGVDFPSDEPGIWSACQQRLVDNVMDDNDLSFSSLRALAKINQNLAVELSLQALTEYNTSTYNKSAAAQDVLVNYLQENEDIQTKDQFVENCFLILGDLNASEDLRIKTGYSLSEIKDISVLRRLMEQNQDRNIEVSLVDKNTGYFRSLLQEGTDDDTLDFILDCMDALPIVDLADEAQAAVEQSGNPEIQKKAVAILEKMRTEGVLSIEEIHKRDSAERND